MSSAGGSYSALGHKYVSNACVTSTGSAHEKLCFLDCKSTKLHRSTILILAHILLSWNCHGIAMALPWQSHCTAMSVSWPGQSHGSAMASPWVPRHCQGSHFTSMAVPWQVIFTRLERSARLHCWLTGCDVPVRPFLPGQTYLVTYPVDFQCAAFLEHPCKMIRCFYRDCAKEVSVALDPELTEYE